MPGMRLFVMIEEPENHLSHTSLTTLLSRIESLTGDQQQLFITTHSTFVLNRLGLDAILLLADGAASKITSLDPETVSYFQRLPGYDTLRMALAKKIVLVEGPSDEIVFERFFRDMFGKRPMEMGIDVISMRGLSLSRCLEFCAALDKPVAAMRDNDGADPSELRANVEQWLSTGKREVFIGDVAHGQTLEPQLVRHNSEAALRALLGITMAADLDKWMAREKTEAAIRIAGAEATLTPPDYMRRAATFIYG
jgi:putative ATP-dependent endonuclease of the OLD family